MENESYLTKPVLTMNEAAAYLRVHSNTVKRHKEIPRFYIGPRALFRREALDKFIAENEKSGIDLNKTGPKKCRKS